eukprot:gene25323-33854_t
MAHSSLQALLLIVSSIPYVLSFQVSANLSEYGVDVSYPIHHFLDEKVSPYFKKRYESLMEGCYKLYSKRECDATERARLEMNLAQPKTEHNYTKVGFLKRKIPKAAWEPLIQFYERHKNEKKLEAWSRGYTYVNTWESPSYMISFEDGSFRDGAATKQLLWQHVQPIIEEWVGRKVEPTSLYGIRIYTENSILATHVDRLPLVSSAIMNVAQDVDEPWPAEVYDHDGKAYNVTMEPGDMVLYESATVLHGRPFPLKGRSYANVFIHYKPLDHDENNRRDHQPKVADSKGRSLVTLKAMKERYMMIGGHEQSNHEQEAIDRHLQDIDNEVQQLKREILTKDRDYKFNPNDEPGFAIRRAAQNGDVPGIEYLLRRNPNQINEADDNGWQALHEAIRGGYPEIVKYLVEMGADLGGRTGNGETPLMIARAYLPVNHAIIEYLLSAQRCPEIILV